MTTESNTMTPEQRAEWLDFFEGLPPETKDRMMRFAERYANKDPEMREREAPEVPPKADNETAKQEREKLDDGVLMIDPGASLFDLENARDLRIARCRSILQALFELGQSDLEYRALAGSAEAAMYLLDEASAINQRQWKVFHGRHPKQEVPTSG